MKLIEFDVDKSNADLDFYLTELEMISGKITQKEIDECFSEFNKATEAVTTKRYKIPVNSLRITKGGLDGIMLAMEPYKKIFLLLYPAVFTEDQNLIDLLVKKIQATNKGAKNVKNYFIRASQIRSVFNAINQSEAFRIDCLKAFENINSCMILKLNAYLCSVFFGYERMSSSLDDIVEKQKRRLLKNKVALQDEDDFILKKAQAYALKLGQQYDSKKGDLRFIKDTLSGVHSSFFLQEIYHKNMINIKSATAKEKNIIFYPLLKLVAIDKPLYDFQDFQNSDYAITSKTLEAKKKAFNRYMNKQVINFLSIKK